MKVYNEEELQALKADHDVAHEAKLRRWRQGGKETGEPRKTGTPVQEYICVCYLLHSRGQATGGNCPLCKAAGSPMKGCFACSCMCCAGPFKDSERQDLARFVSLKRDNKTSGPATEASTKSKLGHFVVMAAQQGARDLEANGDDSHDPIAIQGATSFNLKNAQFEEDAEQHHLRNLLGPLSDTFPDGTHHSTIAGRKKGKRFYQNGLAHSGETGRVPAAAVAAPRTPSMAKRVRRKIKANRDKATPDTQQAFAAISDDIADNNNNATKDAIKDGEEDGDMSQDVLAHVVFLKKQKLARG